jgi:hypothetical protein
VSYKINGLINTIKKIIFLKRTRITLYIAAVLWLAVVTQIGVNHLFRKDFQITEAFVKSDMQVMNSSIEIVAEYKMTTINEKDKREVIANIANAIGLVIDKDITLIKDGIRTEYSFTKKAKEAESEIKVISIEHKEQKGTEMKHYIIVRLNVSHSIQNIDAYKNIVEETLTKMGIENKQITMQFTGNLDGVRSEEEKEQIAESLVKKLQGKIAMDYKEGDLYTVYAYSGLINEYIISMDTKVNIQIAISYNELTNKTRVVLATPILNQSW